MKADERAKLIQRYRDGYSVVKEALSGITQDELDRSASGDWTPRQIAHHLADSEMMSGGCSPRTSRSSTVMTRPPLPAS